MALSQATLGAFAEVVLSGEVARVWCFLLDGRRRSSSEIAAHLGRTTAAATARVRDLRGIVGEAAVPHSERDEDGVYRYELRPLCAPPVRLGGA